MLKQFAYVGLFGAMVAVVGVIALKGAVSIGPVILILSLLPVIGLVLARRSLAGAIPDLIFGSIDTGLLTIPALAGGTMFGVAGAIAGGVIGDALTDGIAGFFEGSIAERLRSKGIVESREPVTTSLGKMAGCMCGSGTILSIALIFGLNPRIV